MGLPRRVPAMRARRRAAFRQAEQLFTRARRRLADPAVSLGLAIPFLGPNLRAARDLTGVGVDLAQAGDHLATTADPRRLEIVNATVNLAELEHLQPEFETAARTVASARQRVEAIDTAFLIASIANPIAKLDRRLVSAVRESATAALASRVLPAILGGDGPRRYFLAVQNNAEAPRRAASSGTGGRSAPSTAPSISVSSSPSARSIRLPTKSGRSKHPPTIRPATRSSFPSTNCET